MSQHPQTRGGPFMAQGQSVDAEGLKWMEFSMVGSEAEAPYNIIQGSLANPNLSVSVGPPLPKRQRQAATMTAASPTVQEPEAITPKPKGDASVSKEEIPAEMEPWRINVGNTRWVYYCLVEGCIEGPSTFQVAIWSHMHQTHLGTKLSCAFCPQTFFNTGALQCHDKWVHPSGSSDPVLSFISLFFLF